MIGWLLSRNTQVFPLLRIIVLLNILMRLVAFQLLIRLAEFLLPWHCHVTKLRAHKHTCWHAVYPLNGEKGCKIYELWSYLCTVDRQSCRRNLFLCYNLRPQSDRTVRTFLPLQRISQQKDLVRTCRNVTSLGNMGKRTLLEKIYNGRNKYLPKTMLQKFSMLTGTLNSKTPAIEMGILFREPMRLKRRTK